MPSLDEPQQRFLDDVRVLKRDYDEEAAKQAARLKAVEDECGRKLEAARRKHREAAVEANGLFRERISQAAQIRSSQADDNGVSDIEAAANRLGALIGGVCHDEFNFNDDLARATLESEASERERIRLENEKKRTYNSLVIIP